MALLNIVVLNYNNYEDAKECLDSLKYIDNKDISIIVADNGSRDTSTHDLQKEFPGFRYAYNQENNGFPGGANFAIKEAIKDKDCEYVFLLTNDTVLKKDSIENFLKIASKEEYKKFGSFQTQMVWYYHKELLDSAGLVYSNNSLGFNRGGFESIKNYQEEKEILGCCAGACIYRRESIEELINKDGEFFDEDFFAYYEDMDVSFRLQWRGWRALYFPEVVVYHKVSKTFKQDPSQKVYLGQRNNIYVLLKDLPLSFVLINSIFIFVAQVGLFFVKFFQNREDRFVVIKAKIDALQKFKKMKDKRMKIQTNMENWKYMKKFIVSKWSRNKPKNI
ncbi:MAG: glycosyltransferase family 2 protein [bacterium]